MANTSSYNPWMKLSYKQEMSGLPKRAKKKPKKKPNVMGSAAYLKKKILEEEKRRRRLQRLGK